MKKLLSLLAIFCLFTLTTVVAASTSSNSSQQMSVSSYSNLEVESEIIKNKLESKPITLSLNNKTFRTSLEELGVELTINPQESTSNKFTNLASGLTKQKNYQYNILIENQESIIQSSILRLFQLQERPLNPSLSLESGDYLITSGQVGHQINNLSQSILDITDVVQSKESSTVFLSATEIMPVVTNAELYNFKDLLESFEPVNLIFKAKNDQYYKSIQLSNVDLALESSQVLAISDRSFTTILDDVIYDLEQEQEDFTITEINPDNNEIKAEGNLKDGIKINQPKLRSLINAAINSNNTEINVPLDIVKSKVINNYNDDIYTLLGSGISNYAGSGAGRVHNIQYASDSRYKTIYVPQGETFKFNSYLGGPVTISRGWQNAYIISGGKIVPAPGGGICQMSTTFYRAALNSGLQIDKKSNHSLYVKYYAAYGDGLDAAIFPGSKDLHFTNNTPSNIILHSFYNAETQDLTVNILGKSDGRHTELFGPYTAGDNASNPFDLKTRTNQINWVRQITDQQGELTEEVLTSTYSKFYRN